MSYVAVNLKKVNRAHFRLKKEKVPYNLNFIIILLILLATIYLKKNLQLLSALEFRVYELIP